MLQEEFKKEVVPLRKKMFSFAQRMLGEGDEAEDIVQEVCLKLWYMRSDLQSYNNIEALSIRITKNLCINRLLVRERTEGGLDKLNVLNEEPTPDILLEQKDDLEHVMRIIDRLPALQQAILRMKHVDGFEVREIAELTGSNEKAVRTNLSRARKKVRDEFFKVQNKNG